MKKVLAICLGLVVAFGLTEGGLRLLTVVTKNPDRKALERSVATSGPIIRRLKTYKVPRLRIVTAGDSFTFGFGVEESEAYPARLVHAFNSRRRGVEVVSFSRPGWNTHLESKALGEHLRELAPDVLILGYCLNDAEPVASDGMIQRFPELLPWQPASAGLEAVLVRSSVLYSKLRRAVDNVRLRRRLTRHYFDVYSDPKGTKRWEKALGDVNRIAAEISVPAVLVIFPIFDSELDEYAYGPLHDQVALKGREKGFEVLDLLPFFEGSAGEDLAVDPYSDPHPSPLAHGIAAEALADFLEERNLLQPAPHSPWYGVGENSS